MCVQIPASLLKSKQKDSVSVSECSIFRLLLTISNRSLQNASRKISVSMFLEKDACTRTSSYHTVGHFDKQS